MQVCELYSKFKAFLTSSNICNKNIENIYDLCVCIDMVADFIHCKLYHALWCTVNILSPWVCRSHTKIPSKATDASVFSAKMYGKMKKNTNIPAVFSVMLFLFMYKYIHTQYMAIDCICYRIYMGEILYTFYDILHTLRALPLHFAYV